MPMAVLSNFLIYCVINAFTPGPGNILALNTVTNYGYKKGKPLFFGIFAGYYVVQILCAIFVYGVNSLLPNVMEVMKYIGAAYILWLAIHIAFHTIHNYIDTKEMILRKGSIAAHKGEKVLIPINMRDGSVLAVGKGNPEWNYSAPHGAGRIMSRSKAKSTLSMEEYQETMKGIYTTSVTTATIDEAPMAYKSLEDIIDVIRDSVDIIEIMKPIYNFKSEK